MPTRLRSLASCSQPSLALAFAALVVGVATAPLAAQTAYTMHQLAPGVHAAIREMPPGSASDSNVLIVINESDVVVVDANILPSSARQMVAEIKKLTPNPVRYVINTHWHSDHHYGNQVYREAWPGVEIIQHPRTRELVISDDIPALKKNLEVEYPATIARLRKALETGVRSTGEPVTEEQRNRFTAALQTYQTFMADMTAVAIVPGTLTVAEGLVLHRGERTIEVEFLGRGNTPGDLVVHLPRERILATGDLVVHPIPFAFFSPLADWPQTLRELKRLDATTILPGHGELQRDWSYVDRLIALIESVWSQVQQAVAGGADLEATRQAVNLDSFLPAFGGEDRRLEFEYLFLDPAVEAGYKALRPEAAVPEGE